MTVPHARAPDAARRSRLVVRAGQLLDGKKVKKVVLAYSGGLDTSVILTWLRDTYDCEVVTFTADLGQVGPNEMKLNQCSPYGSNHSCLRCGIKPAFAYP